MAVIRAKRRLWILLALLAAAAIFFLAPDYTALQRAADAEALETLLPEAGSQRDLELPVVDISVDRYRAAILVDVVFASLYAVVALSLIPPPTSSRSSKTSSLMNVGAALIVMGAAFDWIENGLLWLNLDDASYVAEMRAVGTAKWIGVLAGLILVVASAIVDRRTRLRGEARAG